MSQRCLDSCGILGEFLKLSKPQFSHLRNGDYNSKELL